MKKWIKNLMAMAIIAALIIGGIFIFIHFYTGHGETNVKVPKIEGLKINKAIELLESEGFKYTITDTVYQDNQELLTIVDQTPEHNQEVKPGRRIYLVMNAVTVPKVKMPDLAMKTSYDQAIRVLKNVGLKVGKKIKRPHRLVSDPDSEPVMAQRISGDTTTISPGTLINRNTKIDLVVGTMIQVVEEDATDLESSGS